MIWIRSKPDRVYPTLDSIQPTYSQHQRRIEHEQDIYQDKNDWKVYGSMVSFIIFIVLLFLTVGGIPIIVTKVKKESNCSETSNPRHTLVNYGYMKLCVGNALWDSKGVTIAGLANGLPSTSLGGLQYPTDIYVYENGETIFIADANNNRITKWNRNATVGVLIAGTGSSGSWSTLLTRPTALAVRNELLYVSDLENYRIQVFPLDTNISTPEGVTLIGGDGQGSGITQINQVTNLIIPSFLSSLLYMADSQNHRILLWNSQTNTMQLVAGESSIFGSDLMHLNNPYGIALDENTNSLYIADKSNNRIQKYDMNKKKSSITVAGWGQLNNPSSVQLDPSGSNMFITDSLNHRILLWLNGSENGRIIAGTGVPGNNEYQLNNPLQIRFDSSYNLYVVDTNNSRIQRFNLISNGC